MKSFYRKFSRWNFYMNSLNLKNRRRLKRSFTFIIAFVIIVLYIDRKHSRTSSLNSDYPKGDDPPVQYKMDNTHKMSAIFNMEFINPSHLMFNSFGHHFVPVIILSKAANAEVRDAIRRTWGSERIYNNTLLKSFFFVGTDDFTLQRVKMEQLVFDDVIHVSIPDLYTFSAYKELAAMYWVKKYLPMAKYFIKTEDDTIINVPTLVTKVLPHINTREQTIYGWFGKNSIIKRSPEYQKFVDALVPPSDDLFFAVNLCYIVTAVAIDMMLETLGNIEFIEYPGDSFVTGMLRDAAKVNITSFDFNGHKYRFQVANGKCMQVFRQDPRLLSCTTSLHAGSLRSMPEYFDAWDVIINQTNFID
ncbi:unnamed protein product [Didymodactylos carnosus]|uniref:Hexosyltransferase n=1 Tax=Didymodactylos carnosus TaxID=1234261 RepID=A0A814W7D5_9BILA|nr:unnamed protein product [Didymodactylos carnosus]CAF1200239.1 unnamed protein product [Didymodactylos carnosus]CAF3698059.1 unnamed protein product [Didymodactylos carnosus]CAF3964724.1 unnamed protein product [Didymodactylos carnosus]